MPEGTEEQRLGNPEFPTVEQQLAKARVIHGSAFEQFIRQNQDVHLLRAEEHDNDGIGVPLWLRVFWRKQHPDSYSPAGAKGDYPEVLHRIEEWMEANQDLKPDPGSWLNPTQKRPG